MVPGVNKELLVLATGAGSLILSHVNDAGFWLVKQYFNMTVVETFKTVSYTHLDVYKRQRWPLSWKRTRPSTVAKIVWSVPMPTPVPGLNLVPR